MKCEWKQIRIGDLGLVITGKTPQTKNAKYWGGHRLFITPKDLQRTKHIFQTERIITDAGLESVKGCKLPARAVCVSCIGNIGYVGMTTQDCISNQQINSIVVNKDYEADYVYYVMRGLWPLFKKYEGSSTALSILNKSQFSNIRVRVVTDIKVQRRIAAILSSLDDKIELNNKINANLERQAQAVFTAWFAEAKPSVSFVSLVRVLGGGTPRTSVAEFWEGEIPFFTPKDVYGVYTLETEKSLTDDGLAHCNSCLFPTNTVFVTARGTVGKLTLAGRPMAMNQSCYALLGQEGYGQYFVYHLAQRVITHLKHKANGAVFDAIVTRDFECEFVPDIKPSEAANFELKVKPLYEAILRNYEENCRLSALRDMLLPRLISDDLLPLEFQ